MFRKRVYNYTPKLVDEIVVRDFDFEFPPDFDPIWIPENPAKSHFWNGVSLTMPYLEPYLVKTNHEAIDKIQNKDLLEDVKRFNAQETKHFRCHRKVNDILKGNGYPILSIVENVIRRHYTKLSKKKLVTRLAYSAGFETMTKGFGLWMTNKRRKLWKGADRHMTSFWLMHMTEESEHKTVAYDVYMSVYGDKYVDRALGVLHGSFGVLGLGLLGMLAAMKQDGSICRVSNWWAVVWLLFRIFWNVGPYLLHAMLPWHNPRNFPDSEWITEWIEGHKTLKEGDRIPLVDTEHPDIPVPF